MKAVHPIKVLCVDDNAMIVMATQATIDATPDMDCVGCLYSADKLLDTVAELRPDAVLLDLTMPGKEPLAALRELTDAHPEVPVIVFSGLSDRGTAESAFAAGARRYLTKGCDGRPVLEAIRAVASAPFPSLGIAS
ncbi:response regulator transcription factor [Skermanella sp. TT6]|uniref:Response regulator transcription factor n=1 Tax=Skermanella cutis TaxID=2775420 RepID=A0ABX7B136_9PROT|nr:response regulator transcription factor [Skermanella sp. TT6]QQP87983.1 response regulator transcription factor [Skermanella sp. TT6]